MKEIQDKTKIKIRISFILTMTLSILAFPAFAAILKYKFGISIPCMLNITTGLNCPGCGITRMFDSLLHFKIYQAFRYNPFLFITLPIFGLIYFIECIKYIRFGEFSDKYTTFLITYGIFLVLFGILRNTETFKFLSPIKI